MSIPDEGFLDTLSGVVHCPADLDQLGIRVLVVHLRRAASGTGERAAEREIGLDASRPRRRFSVYADGAPDDRVEVRAVAHFDRAKTLGGDARVATSSWRTVPLGTVVVDPEEMGLVHALSIRLGSAPDPAVLPVRVLVESVEPVETGQTDATTVELDQENPSATVLLRGGEECSGRYHVKAMWYGSGGPLGPVEVDGSGRSTVVLDPPDSSGSREVRLTLDDGAGQLVRAMVELESEGARPDGRDRGVVDLLGHGATGAWRVTDPDPRQGAPIRARVTTIARGGRVVRGEWTTVRASELRVDGETATLVELAKALDVRQSEPGK